MPIIKNNLYYELTSETKTKPVSAVKIQMDVLDGCEHNCNGCFVNRRNNNPSVKHLKDFSSFIGSITDEGVLVDEILIGPTDFLSSINNYSVLSNKSLLAVINKNSPILAFVTTLISGDLKRFCDFLKDNINLDTEIEIGIATNPDELMSLEYSRMVKSKLEFLSSNIEHDITYTFIINVDDVSRSYESLHSFVVKQFDTTFDLVPSIARSKNKVRILDKITGLNINYNRLDAGNSANNIMVDHSHSGTNFKVLNFKRGDWWVSPFLYENMAIYDDLFKINKFSEVQTMLERQYSYDTECSSCNFLTSCSSRFIPTLMKYLDTESCVCPKENMTKNIHSYNKASMEMYNWDEYSVSSDKKGYRKKFLIHDEGSEELVKIKRIYDGAS
jgi:hypothetical protein